MKKKLNILAFALTFFCFSANAQVSADSLNTLRNNLKIKIIQDKVIKDKINSLSKSSTQVKIIETCSNNPDLCGTMAFGSAAKVVILNGKYSGDTVFIATLCSSTFYEMKKTYTVSIHTAPNFSVHFCYGQTYNYDWNYKLNEHKYMLFFGELKKSDSL
jgi:hypothetical protein